MPWGYSYNYNSAGIPALMNWFDAKQHFEQVKPIRGRANPDAQKPLGSNRRYSWYRIMKKTTSVQDVGDDLGRFVDIYGAMLYGHNNLPAFDPFTIEFHENGEIHINPIYHCPTTLGFINNTLRAYGEVHSFRGKWYWVNKDGGSCYPINFATDAKQGEVNKFIINGTKLDPVNPTQEYKYLANRKVLNRLRKQYRPFTEYVNNALLVCDEVERLELAEARHGLNFERMGLFANSRWYGEDKKLEAKKARDYLFSVITKAQDTNDYDMMFEAMQFLCCVAGKYSYSAGKYRCSPQQFNKYFDDVLKATHRDEVFRKELVPVGTPFVDGNAWFISC